MRPKNRVLLIDANEERSSLLRFRLHTHGLAVISAASAEEAITLYAAHPDLVAVASDLPGRDALLNLLHEERLFIPQLVLAKRKEECTAIADAIAHDPLFEDLLSQIKFLAARKRGPRKAKPVASEWRTEAERLAGRALVEKVLNVEMPERRTA